MCETTLECKCYIRTAMKKKNHDLLLEYAREGTDALIRDIMLERRPSIAEERKLLEKLAEEFALMDEKNELGAKYQQAGEESYFVEK